MSEFTENSNKDKPRTGIRSGLISSVLSTIMAVVGFTALFHLNPIYTNTDATTSNRRLQGNRSTSERCKELCESKKNFNEKLMKKCGCLINDYADSSYDAIIVGAGWAGLSAAVTLKDRGVKNILILEARDRIGGRSHTVTNFFPNSNDPIELGSEFLYTKWNNEVIDIFDSERVEYTGITNSFATFTADGPIKPKRNQQLHSDLWTNGFLRYARKKSRITQKDSDYDTMLKNYEEDEGISDIFEQQYLELESANVALEFAADTSQLSIKETIDWLGSAESEMTNPSVKGRGFFRVSKKFVSEIMDQESEMAISSVEGGGFGRAINIFATEIMDKIQLETEVTRIDYSGPGAVVTYTGKDGAVNIARASTVLITVPLGVLKTNSINFTPPLPKRKKRAIKKMKVGALDKFIMYWDEKAMASAPQFLSAWDNSMDKDWLELVTPETETSRIFTTYFNSRKYTRKFTLTGWIAGSDAVAMEKLKDKAVLEAVIFHLRTIFALDVPSPTNFVMTRWSQDEYAKGAYCFPYVGQSFSATASAIAKPVDDTLFFAGEHISKYWSGTTVGAYETGKDAAKNMANIIKNEVDATTHVKINAVVA